MKHPRGAAGSDLIFFIFFLIVLGIVWGLTGGPERAISTSGPFLNPPFPLGSGSAYNVPGVTIPAPGGGDTSARERSESERNVLQNIISDIRASFGGIQEKASPFAGSVSLSAGSARNADAAEEYVAIKTGKALDGRVNISAWRIESSLTLRGTTLGDAAYLPYAGEVNAESPVAIPAGTTVYVVTGRSPIGVSLRVNQCTGYFAQFQDFAPKLREECPAPEDEFARKIQSGFLPNESCIDFVEDLDRCTFTGVGLPPAIGGQCQDFVLNDLTYNGCVDAHKNDDGFYKSEWRIYLDRDQELWKSAHERIRLLDENGLVIDSVSY